MRFVAKRKKHEIKEVEGAEEHPSTDRNYAFRAKFSYEIIILINFSVTNVLVTPARWLPLPLLLVACGIMLCIINK